MKTDLSKLHHHLKDVIRQRRSSLPHELAALESNEYAMLVDVDNWLSDYSLTSEFQPPRAITPDARTVIPGHEVTYHSTSQDDRQDDRQSAAKLKEFVASATKPDHRRDIAIANGVLDVLRENDVPEERAIAMSKQIMRVLERKAL